MSSTRPEVEGLILDKHGIFTFGASAREAYERMIEMVTLAEDRLSAGRKAVFKAAALPQAMAPLAEGGADPARGLQPGRREDRRRVAAAGAGVRAGDAVRNFVDARRSRLRRAASSHPTTASAPRAGR
jgi:rhamnose utilization protein RhaD (predicted bifunctional aldolase and dehydrogenase)